jgi:GxxExxY protein
VYSVEISVLSVIQTRKSMNKHELAHGEITGRILKCAVEVHRTLGPGFQELVYQRALARELEAEGLACTREEWVPVFYKGEKLDTRRVDFIIEDVLVEVKAKAELAEADFIQTLSYLKASGYRVALLLNFGARRLQSKRLIYG